MSEAAPLSRRLLAEALGSAILVATVVGSGIMADKLAGGNQAIALLGNTIPTGAILVVLITILGPISGAHFNPAVSLVFASRGDLPWRDVLPYIILQCLGGIAGTIIAHLMFDLAPIMIGTTARSGPSQWLAEAVATFGDFKKNRDTLIHARIINVTIGVGRGAKQRGGKSSFEVLLSADVLNAFYDHIVALKNELASGAVLLNTSVTLKLGNSDDPGRPQLEKALRSHQAQYRESRKYRRSLKPLPKFPDEDELRQAANKQREAQTAVIMSWFQPLSEPVQTRSWVGPGLIAFSGTPHPLVAEAEKKKPKKE